MLYVVGFAGVALLIVGLLWQMEKARRQRAEQARDIALARVTALHEQITLERKLRTLVSPAERVEIEAKIKEAEARAIGLQPGERTTDLFGTGGGTPP